MPPIVDPTTIDYMEMKGNVHSTESLACLEGPGNRFLLFLNGCAARCLYCSNPDTWDETIGTPMTVAELIKKIGNLKNYYINSVGGGGVTVSGGEPLTQFAFLTCFLYAVKKHLGLHTCVETTGQGCTKAWNSVLPHTDLCLVCIKHAIPEKYEQITRTKKLDRCLKFLKELEKRNIPWWCRYVVLPGYTDSKEDIEALIELVKNSPTCERIEFLPYHELGKNKWEELGIEYPLKNIKQLKKSEIKWICDMVREAFKDRNIPVTGDS